jgi:hypothetical protein
MIEKKKMKGKKKNGQDLHVLWPAGNKDGRFSIRPRPRITTFQKKKKKERKKKKRKKKKKEKDQDLHVLTLQYRTLFRDCFLADTTLFHGK